MPWDRYRNQYPFLPSSKAKEGLAVHAEAQNKEFISLPSSGLLCLLRNLWLMGCQGEWYVQLPDDAFKKKGHSLPFSCLDCELDREPSWNANESIILGRRNSNREGVWISEQLHGGKPPHLPWMLTSKWLHVREISFFPKLLLFRVLVSHSQICVLPNS